MKTLNKNFSIRICLFSILSIGFGFQGIESESVHATPSRGRKTDDTIRVVPNIAFCPRGNQKLILDYAVPYNFSGSLKPVILVHGGAWVAGNKTHHHQDMRIIAENGGFAASINYRLANGKMTYIQQLEDIDCAINWLQENANQLNIDAREITLGGQSAGGHLALLSAIRNQDVVKTVVSLAGPTDLFSWHGVCNSQSKRTKGCHLFEKVMDYTIGKQWREHDDQLEVASPITFVSQIGADQKFILAHGTSDSLVPTWQSQKFCKRAQAWGKTCELILLPGVNHLIASVKSRRSIWKRALGKSEL